MQEGFIFGAGTGKTYADMTRAREIAKALTDGMPQAPKNVGEGLNAIGSALMARAQTKRADKMRDDLAGQMTPDHPLFAKLYGLPAYRNGTNFHPGGMAVVGEDGPEVVQLPRGAAVIPNPMTMAYRPGVDQANVYQGPATAGMAQVMQAQADPDPTAKGTMFFVDPEGTVPPQLLERFKQLPMDMQRSIVDEIMKGAPAQELIPPARKSSIAPDPAAVMASINPQPVKPQSRMMDAQAVQVADASGARPVFDEKLTEGQSKDVNFFRRGLAANQELEQFESALLQYTDNFAGNFGALGRAFQDEEYQKAMRAAREVLAVILRKDTGAAVTNEEFAMYTPMYIPQPGDKPGVLEAKRQARQQFFTAMQDGMGTAAPIAQFTREELMNMNDDDFLKSLGIE